MDKKKLVSQSAQPVTNLIQNLPIELAELSEEELSQVNGGICFCCGCWWPDDRLTFNPVDLETSVCVGGWPDDLLTFNPVDLETSVIN